MSSLQPNSSAQGCGNDASQPLFRQPQSSLEGPWWLGQLQGHSSTEQRVKPTPFTRSGALILHELEMQRSSLGITEAGKPAGLISLMDKGRLHFPAPLPTEDALPTGGSPLCGTAQKTFVLMPATDHSPAHGTAQQPPQPAQL